ncbi:cupin-like domain-containing protein [Phenylobacterium sp. J367]|uniref:cupin-like domain-containing protein n=1 Tax=Phenylobacterium sp. J367 TaxID=2898435 RepID=UPI002150F429|nr:cupin-like domain-containing protein [Phenylobacterium sp. J367]MCR5881070.1 cupin-like domain-containing protein [Phenylobacterium sp. J367]
MAVPRPVEEVRGVTPDAIPFDEILEGQRPMVFKGMVADWPLVRQGLQSPGAAIAYLKAFDGGEPVVGYTGGPEIGGRFFYDDTLTRLNFRAERVGLSAFLDRMAATPDDGDAPSLYIGSTDLDGYLPGFRAENDLGLDPAAFGGRDPLVSIWIGNRTTAAAHYDMSNNIACCVVGRRRFTLFPPDQVANLYPGPLEPTPGGQVVTTVDLRDPDFERFPRVRDALARAQVADLEPGDVLVYPALWWHEVEALEPFNALVNYWWNPSPGFVDTPQTTLLHALLSLRDRPEHEKAGWRALFDYYVFGPSDAAASHLPEAAQGLLGPLDEMKARRLRAQLINRLNR